MAEIFSEKETKILTSFAWVPPTPANQEKFDKVTDAAKNLAKVIIENVPDCADRTHALRLLRDVRMWSNAAISLEGLI